MFFRLLIHPVRQHRWGARHVSGGDNIVRCVTDHPCPLDTKVFIATVTGLLGLAGASSMHHRVEHVGSEVCEESLRVGSWTSVSESVTRLENRE